MGEGQAPGTPLCISPGADRIGSGFAWLWILGWELWAVSWLIGCRPIQPGGALHDQGSWRL